MRKLSIFFLSVCFLLFTGSVGAQNTITSTTGSIDWSLPSSWVGGNAPGAGDNVLIAAGATVSITTSSATCNSISFADNTAKIALTSPSSVLSVNGDFSFATTTHAPFSSWATGAKLKFVGGTATQTIKVGTSSATTSGNYGIMEMVVEKNSGVVTTVGADAKLCIGTNLTIASGTFRLGVADDLYGVGLTTAGTSTSTQPTITIQNGGTLYFNGNAVNTVNGNSQINSGTTSSSGPIGKLTINSGGIADISTNSTAGVQFGGIDVESGGTLRLNTGWGTSTSSYYFFPALLTVKSGGTLEILTTGSRIWAPTASTLVLNSGSIVSVTSSTHTLPANFTDNGATWKFTRSSSQSIMNLTYSNVELSGLNTAGATKTIITASTISGVITMGTAAGTMTVTGKLSMLQGATLSGTGVIAYGPAATLQYGASTGETASRTSIDTEWPVVNGPQNVTIWNPFGVTLSATRTIPGLLTLTSGVLSLGDNSLTAATASSSGSGYVQTNGNGTFTLSGVSTTPALFPVGNNAYNPVTITNNSGLAGDFSVRVIDEVYNSGSSTGSLMTGPRVRRTWMIAKSNANSGSGVNFNFNWNPSEVTGSLPTPALYNYSGGNWVRQTGSTSSTATSLSYTSFTGTLSSFAIGDNTTPLPVSLSSFTAIKVGKNNLLTWATASEQNNAGFEVQRSTDGTTYENIGFVKSLSATGNSSSPLSYSFTDFSPLGLQQYYRLKQTDLDGKFAYSAIVLVKREAPTELTVTKVYPNPSTSSIYINAACPAATTLQLSIVDMNGRVVGRKQVNALAGNNGFDMPVAQLAPGTYLLQVINVNKQVVATEKFIKQ